MFLRVIFLITLVVLSSAAPKSRNKGPQLVYDQKQKGEHNIQVHLKDFQIIALLGGDSFGGDYDYNYEYADFTIKPGVSSSTTTSTSEPSPKPSPESSTTTTTPKPSTEAPVLITSEETIIKVSDAEKPLALLGEATSSTTPKEIPASSTPKMSTEEAKPLVADAIPGQIQVQILESPEGYPNFAVRKDTTYEEISRNPPGKSEEKKCLTGYIRDKKGRCRRIRRPQSTIPFDFGRLAHLAARFKADKENSGTSTSAKLY